MKKLFIIIVLIFCASIAGAGDSADIEKRLQRVSYIAENSWILVVGCQTDIQDLRYDIRKLVREIAFLKEQYESIQRTAQYDKAGDYEN